MRVKKIDGPILVLGLGGTGFDAVMRVKHDFSQRFETEVFNDGSRGNRPPRTEYCVIDTDASVSSMRKYGMRLEQDEFIDISGDFSAVRAAMQSKNYIAEWLDPNLAVSDVNANGAGCYRQISRLFLFNKIQNVITQLTGKLNTLKNVPAGAPDKAKTIQVKLIAGISGGTGSGTLLDTAYILRSIAAQMPCSINIEAYLIMPDVTIAYAAKGDPVKTQLYSTNSYALLKELDYWMNADETGISLRQQYSSTTTYVWNGIPFDDVHLLCSQNDNGVSIEGAYNHTMQVISEYLVHCYESTDDTGSENFSVLNSQDGGATNANNSFSFQSARSNQMAIVNMMDHPYPVAYRYHSLGAFSNAGEDRLLELKEWTMIYKEVVGRIEEHPALMNGQAPVDFCNAILNMQEAGPSSAGNIRANFNRRHPFPGNAPISEQEEYEMKEIESADENSAPHGDLYTQFNKQIGYVQGDEQEKLKKEVWALFESEARKIGEDLACGPEYLYDLLVKGENGLQTKLKNYIETIKSKQRTAASSKDDHLSHAKTKFKEFQDFNIGIAVVSVLKFQFNKKKDLYDSYMSECNMLFDACRSAAYYEALTVALEDLQKQLNGYVAVLGDLVAAVRTQKETYESELQATEILAPLFDVDEMTDSLTKLFADGERRDMFVQMMYRSVMNISMRFMSEYIPPEQLSDRLNATIDELRHNQFIGIGGLTLSQKIQTYQNIAAGAATENYVKTQLCPKLTSGANVMFSVDPSLQGLPATIAAQTTMVVAPNDDDIVRGIQSYCSGLNLNVVLKRAQTGDRIFWVTDKGGMPMYFYSQLNLLKDHYNRSKGIHKAYHLFMANAEAWNALGLNDEMKKDWGSSLPDPFTNRYVKETGDEAEILTAAEKAGVIEHRYNFVPDGVTEPGVSVEQHMLAQINGANVSVHSVKSAMGEIPVNAKEISGLQATAGNIPKFREAVETLEQYLEQLKRIYNNRVNGPVAIDHLKDKAAAWGQVLGVKNRMINLNPAMDDPQVESVKEAWRMANDRAIREALCRRPDLLAQLKIHTTCVGLLDERIKAVEEMIKEIGLKKDSVREVNEDDVLTKSARMARMLIYGQVEAFPAKLLGHLGDGLDKDVFLKSDEQPTLESKYPEYKQFPLLLMASIWYGFEGDKQPAFILLNEMEEETTRVINNKRRRDTQIDECLERTGEIVSDLRSYKTRIKASYLDSKLSQETYTFCNKLIDKMLREVESFIDTWENA